MNRKSLLQYGVLIVGLAVASGCVWNSNETSEFDSRRWQAWPSLGDPYNPDRLEMVSSIQRNFDRATEAKLLSDLGAPDVSTPLLGPSPCEGLDGCKVLRWHLGYEDGPIRLDALTLFVVVQDEVVQTIAVKTL